MDPLFKGFVEGCVNTQELLTARQSLCNLMSEGQRNNRRNMCGHGRLALPTAHLEALDAPGKPNKKNGEKIYGDKTPYLYSEEQNIYSIYRWNYKPNNIFFGPVAVDEVKFIMDSTEFFVSELRLQNVKSVAEVKKLLRENGIKLKKSYSEEQGESGEADIVKGKDGHIYIGCGFH